MVVSGDRLLIINPTEDTHRVCHNVSLDKLTSTYRSTLYPVLKQIFKVDAGGTFGFDESCLEEKYFSGAFFILTLVFYVLVFFNSYLSFNCEVDHFLLCIKRIRIFILFNKENAKYIRWTFLLQFEIVCCLLPGEIFG